MRIILERLKLRKDFNNLNLLIKGTFALGAIGLVAELLYGFIFWSFFLEIGLLLFLYRLYFRTYQRFYYSFWTLNSILFVYIFWSLIKSIIIFESSLCFYLYTLMFVGNIMTSYILFSPIYFPIVNWWEYDFRFRRDIKVNIENGESAFEGRIIDVRREAAGIQCFKKLNVGEKITIIFDGELEGIKLDAEIFSIRKYSFGRPYIVGVKFSTEKNSFQYSKLLKHWKKKKIAITKLRFKSIRREKIESPVEH